MEYKSLYRSLWERLSQKSDSDSTDFAGLNNEISRNELAIDAADTITPEQWTESLAVAASIAVPGFPWSTPQVIKAAKRWICTIIAHVARKEDIKQSISGDVFRSICANSVQPYSKSVSRDSTSTYVLVDSKGTKSSNFSEQKWKSNPQCIACFSWALDKLLPEDTVGVISYILPVILGLLGDYDTREKTRGVNLAIILIGKCNDEFGHLIANAADSVPIDQLKALQSKMSSSSHLARAVALTTVGKIINLFPEIKTLCLRVLDRYRGALDAELQQRACEYYALGTLEGDELLPTVFEEMPPFPERQSALMSRLLKREADTEDQRTWVVGSHENNCKHRGGMSGTASNDSREAVEASAMPVSIASQASNPAGGSTAAPRADAPAASSTPQLTMDPSVAKSMRNYARLLWENDDILFDGEEIQVGVMAQYKPPGGRLGVFLGNRATAPLYSIFITARTADGTQLDIQPAAGQEAKQIPESLMPLAQARVFFDVQCKQVFGAALTLHIGYTVAGSAPTVSELQLPVTVGHFMDPVTISVADFFARWKQLGDSGIAESQHVLPSAFLTKDAAGLEWLRSVVGGMSFALIQGADPEPNNIVGVGIATTQAGRFGCLMCVEPKPAHGLTRVTLRATNAEVARSIGSNIKMVFESK